MIIENLSPEKCAAVLSANHTASLACVRDGRPYLVPISYAYSQGFIYSFSLEGQKTIWMRDNASVSLLVVDHGAGRAWKSVIVEGTFEEFPDDRYFEHERDVAWKALSKRADWWDPGSLKLAREGGSAPADYIYYSIRIDAMTGRVARDEAATEPQYPRTDIRARVTSPSLGASK